METKKRRRLIKPRQPSKKIAIMRGCGCCIYFETNQKYSQEQRKYLEECRMFQGEHI